MVTNTVAETYNLSHSGEHPNVSRLNGVKTLGEDTAPHKPSISSISSSYASPIAQRDRIRDSLRALPVVAVALLAALLYLVFVLLHCLPLIQLKVPYESRDDSARLRGVIQCLVFHFLFIMFVVTYVLTVITPAGGIPYTPEWRTTFDSSMSPLLFYRSKQFDDLSSPPEPASPGSQSPLKQRNERKTKTPSPRLLPAAVEIKRTGDRRFCKWCCATKPDRAHHCRVCRQCVLRMDHHCPWVFNCIGFGNHKYFLLLLIYTSATLIFGIGCQMESLIRAIDEPLVPNGNLFLLLFAESLGGLLAVVSTFFLCFHFWLVLSEMSTIEFCEKRFRREQKVDVYNRGFCENLHNAFGNSVLFWFLPIDDRKGDGLSFEVSPSRVADIQKSSQHSKLKFYNNTPSNDLESQQPLLDDEATQHVVVEIQTPPTPYVHSPRGTPDNEDHSKSTHLATAGSLAR